MRRVAAVALGVLAWIVLATAPAHAQAAERIDRYDVAIVIEDDGSLTVTEKIAYDFASNERHGESPPAKPVARSGIVAAP